MFCLEALEYFNGGVCTKFNDLEKIGEGGFSTVYKARNKKDKIICLKILTVKAMDYKNNVNGVRNEALILNKINHKNILKFYGEYISGDQVILVTEYCDGGSLLDRIQKQSMTEDETDLKPENILLRQNTKYPEVVVADFGLAKVASSDTTCCGTTAYSAPEIINSDITKTSYDNTCDIWSLGVILYVMISGYHPFDINNDVVLGQQKKTEEFSFGGPAWQFKSSSVKNLIREIIKVDPTRRLSIGQIRQHKWVRRCILEYKDILKRMNNEEARLRKLQFSKPSDDQPKMKPINEVDPENSNYITQDRANILPPRYPVSSNYPPIVMPNYICSRFPTDSNYFHPLTQNNTYPIFPYYTIATNSPNPPVESNVLGW
ncbi:Protein kinase [Entamoeba marina]